MSNRTAAAALTDFSRTAVQKPARVNRWASLQHRLPLLMFALLAALGALSAWMAYRQVEQALRTSGTERIGSAAAQVADLFAQSAAARTAEIRRLGSDAGVRETVLAGRLASEAAVPDGLRTYAARNPQATVRLYDAGGRLIAAVRRDSRVPLESDPLRAEPAGAEGVSRLRVLDGRASYQNTVALPGAEAGSAPVGFLAVQRSLAASPAGTLLERLIGAGSVLKLGNAANDVWTDLGAPVSAPPLTAPGQSGVYTSASGQVRRGMALPVAGTPWLVWADVSEAAMLQPASALLRQMLPVSLFLTVLGALAVYAVSRRVTKPLEQVAGAAEALAAGDYSRRVTLERRDEIGRLGAAFNIMAARVGESHEALEARVQARTRELEDARHELDQFFSLSLDLLSIADMEGRFRRVNPAWEQTLGWTAAELTAAPSLDFVHPDDRADAAREAMTLAEGVATVKFHNRYRCKDGSYRWLSWTCAPLPERGLIYAAAHDVTEQRQAARDLQQHAAELASANAELEAFSYSVSHDLRSPLRSIDGFAQALVEDYTDRLDDTGRDFLSRIRAAAQRMGGLIDDLLSLSRVARVELLRADVDLSAQAIEVAARLHDHEPHRRVDWQIAPGLRCRGDARLLRVALENLLSNAWKFTANRDTAVIAFTTERLPDGTDAFVVRDNGAGFEMAHAAKLFGAFQRLHTSAEFPGTGIGLATVFRIVRRHGGRIWADASVGQGAAFFFTLES